MSARKISGQKLWHYTEHTQSRDLLSKVYASKHCACCLSVPLTITDSARESDKQRYSGDTAVFVCQKCGWWSAFRSIVDSSCASSDESLLIVKGSGAALATFSPSMDTTAIEALKKETLSHLKRHGKSNEWDVLEDASGAILTDFGYSVMMTCRQKDGGIDVIAVQPDASRLYAQVKHSKNKIGVRIVRELVGVMLRDGVSEALLVASSSFTDGAMTERELLAKRGFFVEFVDGSSLVSALNLTFRLEVPTLSEILDVASPIVEIKSESIVL